jgi:hypothetical protein
VPLSVPVEVVPLVSVEPVELAEEADRFFHHL